MCGFAGILSNHASRVSGPLAGSMADAMVHRGPDDAGYWADEASGIALAHRRLSILDLSAAGHQPMHSASGRYCIAFNGEIYNHLQLRKVLEGDGHAPAWRGHADTETLLACFEAWGIAGTLENSIGMFAFAVWDRKTQTLILARDRCGEKPVYYGWQRDSFLFASELKAIQQHPAFSNDIDRDAITLLLRHNCIPAPYSIYKGISKLLPGTMATVSLHQPDPVVTTYWSAMDVARSGSDDPDLRSEKEMVDALESLLKDAVGQQMVADVPLGAFLSGGIDSSTIVALMQSLSSRPVKTFTIGFHEQGYNEAEHAKAVAQCLGTDHTEMYVNAEEAMAVIPRLSSIYDEPFADSSQIPTFLVSQLSRQHVTVALSGDGGDELFCGYNRYQLTDRYWHRLAAYPVTWRKAMAAGISILSPQAWGRVADVMGGRIPGLTRLANMGEKLHKAAGVLASRSSDELYLGLVSHWTAPARVVIGAEEPPTRLLAAMRALDSSGMDDAPRMMLLDAMSYLPDDILTKVDRAAMAVSLETRVPFLDHRVVEFAWHMPQAMKLRAGKSKWALRQILYRYVPEALVERPKMGFGIPLHAWLRGPLQEWVESLIDEGRLRREGYFHPEPIRGMWREHLSGRRDRQHLLWDVLMFQAWLDSR